MTNEGQHCNMPWPRRVRGHHQSPHIRWAQMKAGERYLVLFDHHAVGSQDFFRVRFLHASQEWTSLKLRDGCWSLILATSAWSFVQLRKQVH
jgi:hypothetical protein